MSKRVAMIMPAVLAAVLVALAGGCLSDQPGSSSMANVIVANSDFTRIRAAAVKVFGEEYFSVAAETAGELIFEREGTQRDRVLYARYEEKLVMQVVVRISTLPEGRLLVRADAAAMNGGLGATPVRGIAGRPYQKLLNRVKEAAEATILRAEW